MKKIKVKNRYRNKKPKERNFRYKQLFETITKNYIIMIFEEYINKKFIEIDENIKNMENSIEMKESVNKFLKKRQCQ